MGTLPRPAISGDDVVVLVHEAIEFFGRAAAKEQAKLVRAGTTRADWHPWAPAFDWYFRLDLKHTPIDVTPIAGLVARDMHLLKAIPDVLGTPRLRANAAKRVKKEREAALEELRAAGFYSAAGVRAEWTAVTGTDTADVLLPTEGVEFQMKTREFRADPMTNETAILDRIDAARKQLQGGRAGVVVMTVPGVGDWTPWATKNTASPFWARLSGRFPTPEYTAVSAVLLIGDPKIERTPYGGHMWVPAWLIRNDQAAHPLPAAFRLWTDGG